MDTFDFFYSYNISGIIGLIQYWLESDSDKSPEVMAELTSQVMTQELRLFTDTATWKI